MPATTKSRCTVQMQRPLRIWKESDVPYGSGGSGGSSLRRSGLGNCLTGSSFRGSSFRRSSLAGSGLGRGSLRRSCNRGSSLRGGSSGRRRGAAAGSHTNSQSQCSNNNANILEFHIYYLLVLLQSSCRSPTGRTLSARQYFSPFYGKIKCFLYENYIYHGNSADML